MTKRFIQGPAPLPQPGKRPCGCAGENAPCDCPPQATPSSQHLASSVVRGARVPAVGPESRTAPAAKLPTKFYPDVAPRQPDSANGVTLVANLPDLGLSRAELLALSKRFKSVILEELRQSARDQVQVPEPQESIVFDRDPGRNW